MCARFTVLSDAPIAAAIAGCVIPLSRNSTIWMRWRCAAGIFHRSAVFSRRTSALLHLTICLPRIRWRKRITPRPRKTIRQAVYAAYLPRNSRFKPFWRGYKTPFSADPYIAEGRARSVLCLPLTTQGKLIGILYLENNLTPHVFNADRV